MATEDQNIKITVENNFSKATQESNKLGASLDKMEDAGMGAAKSMKNLDATFEEVYGDLQPLTTRMGEAEDRLYELALAGQTAGQEYQDLLIKVAEYRKTQIETDRVVDAAATTLGQKLGGAAQIAATGVQGVTAGMALFGNQSEDTEKALLKVQAAMAFADSISNISTLGGQFRVLQGVVKDTFAKIVAAKATEKAATEAGTVAQLRQNLAVLANPYVIAAAALAALVVGIYAWNKASSEAERKEVALKKSIDSNKIATDNLAESIESANKAASSSNDIETLRARAYGKTDSEIQKIIKSQKELAVSTSMTQSKQAYDNLLKANSDYAKALKTNNQEIIDSAKENQQSARELYKASNDAYNESIIEDVKFTLQSQIDANAKAKEAQEKANDEAEKRREKAKEKSKQDADDAKALAFDNLKADEDLQKELRDKDKENYTKDQEEKQRRDSEDAARKVANWEYLADEEKRIAEAVADAKKTILDKQNQNISDSINLAKGLFEKSKGIQKALLIGESLYGIAKTVISTRAANAAAKLKYALLPGGSLLAAAEATANNIGAGIGIAANVASTAKALQALGGGGGASSAGGVSGGSEARGSAAPSVAFNNSAENQIGQSVNRVQADQPPLQVTVLESDITKAQNNVNVLVDKNKF